MEYVARLLITNEKRVQYQVEERSVATDGLMLNLLSVLQILSVKVSFFLALFGIIRIMTNTTNAVCFCA